ncbi:MHYT domain-containing protein [Streptomyces sp. CB03911]|uniref:MHYT domain-containing protein n=1 Tax=Streptomycetaceae TaxID=2062 RepID=UPI00093A2251|nr:MHYT domain-containing protein [Streptomyces sp. CB03911]OKI24782.1 hypothetical protein A6A07_32070 [Streptomyces sp. CB03911]
MGEIHHAVYGWVTPALSYFTACLGAFVALRGTRWALLSEGRTKANWLLFASMSLGAGIWSMHFIAMLGFSVSGIEIRYDVPLTVLSLIVAIAVVGLGIFVVGYSRNRTGSLLAGGAATGLGVAAMHYMGMAAVEVPGHIAYHQATVGASVVIAVLAATAALWAALNIKGTLAVLAAAPVMGVAVCAMHYTGMAAVSVHLSGARESHGGVLALQFVFPLAVGLGCYVFFSALAFAAAPSKPGAAGRSRPAQPVIAGPAPRLVPRQRAAAGR